MAGKKPIFISCHFEFGQIWKKKKKKNTFPNEIFNEIWLKVGEHDITEITFKKKLLCFKMVARTIFWYCAIGPNALCFLFFFFFP